MEDRLSQWMQLIATVHTGVTFASCNAVELGVYNPTLGAVFDITIALLEYLVEASIFGWELFVELVYGVSHVVIVAHDVLVVKDKITD